MVCQNKAAAKVAAFLLQFLGGRHRRRWRVGMGILKKREVVGSGYKMQQIRLVGKTT